MIDPTDAASDDGWDEAEESQEGSSGGSPDGSAAAGEDKAAPNSARDAGDADRDDDDDDGDDGDDDDFEDDGDGDGSEARDSTGDRDDDAAPKKRRRRKRRSDPYEAPDARAQQALDFVAKVVLEMEMDCKVRLRRPKDAEEVDEVNIEIIGRDAGRIIGKKGAVLQAIQFLTHRVINRPGLDRRHVLVDAEGYRSRRDNSLATMARRLGKQAVDQGKIITFEPMNPRDRRVVHLALAKFEGVITKSDGEGDDRRVQIIPVRR
ncbi:MAG TPA: R3H domain-containing nucleic acid-binding protein [Polyangiaceae bacterium]|nr:R3H domain-containing nucleic acid-binding protein [Polyangiaceae bacterium]